MHFNSSFTWSHNQSFLPDLRTIAAHEIGHALGLGHTQNSRCWSQGKPQNADLYPLMCATIFGFPSGLHADDINAIQSLYGPNEPPGLPDNDVALEITGPNPARDRSQGATYRFRILNGLQTAITNAAVDVTFTPGGADHCDDPSVGTVPARDIVEVTCNLPTQGLLPDQGKSVDFGTLSAELTATGTPNRSAGPLDLDVVPPNAPFSDVPSWVDDAVDWAAFWDIATGYPNGTFRPDLDITRAQVVRMLYRLAGEPDVSGLPDHPFTDVPPWVEDAVKWAAHDPDGAGPLPPLINGYSDNTFRPDISISRGQVIRMLYRYSGVDASGYPDHGLTDVPGWVDEAVRWALHDPDGNGPLEQIATGYSDNTFRPNRDITRAQVMRMIYRLCSHLNP